MEDELEEQDRAMPAGMWWAAWMKTIWREDHLATPYPPHVCISVTMSSASTRGHVPLKNKETSLFVDVQKRISERAPHSGGRMWQ